MEARSGGAVGVRWGARDWGVGTSGRGEEAGTPGDP